MRRRTTTPGVKPFDASASRDAVAKLHRERPDLRGSRCQCPTCRPTARKRSVRRVAAVVAVLALVGASSASANVLCSGPRTCEQVAHAAPAPAPLPVLLYDTTGSVSPSYVRRVASALTVQVNRDLRRYWPGPQVLVVPSGALATGGSWGGDGWTGGPSGAAWQVDLVSPAVCGSTVVVGVHTDYSNAPSASVCLRGGWTVTASHELLEMLEDPTGTVRDHGILREVCDPVEGLSYGLGGVRVSDFVTPRWFAHVPSGHRSTRALFVGSN